MSHTFKLMAELAGVELCLPQRPHDEVQQLEYEEGEEHEQDSEYVSRGYGHAMDLVSSIS